MKILTLIIAVISILLPIISQKSGLSKKYGFKLKMLSAFMYLLTGTMAVLTRGTMTDYSLCMLGALVLGILGDFFLEFKRKKFSLWALYFLHLVI